MAVTFNDGRFDNSSSSATSLFQNISCNDPSSVSTLSQCTMLDSCQSTCDYAVGLRCYGKHEINIYSSIFCFNRNY